MSTEAKSNMLKQQLRTWDVLNPRVLDLFNEIPRELFVPNEYRELAYADIFIPLPHNAFIPPPKEEAKILQALDLNKSHKVLELGVGSGYLTVLLAKLAQHVYSIDLDAERIRELEQKLTKFNLNNVSLFQGPPEQGLKRYAPFDVIVVKGSIPNLPHQLRAMLAESGRIMAIVGNVPAMEATIFKHISGSKWQIEKLFETVWPRLPGVEEPKRFLF